MLQPASVRCGPRSPRAASTGAPSPRAFPICGCRRRRGPAAQPECGAGREPRRAIRHRGQRIDHGLADMIGLADRIAASFLDDDAVDPPLGIMGAEQIMRAFVVACGSALGGRPLVGRAASLGRGFAPVPAGSPPAPWAAGPARGRNGPWSARSCRPDRAAGPARRRPARGLSDRRRRLRRSPRSGRQSRPRPA